MVKSLVRSRKIFAQKSFYAYVLKKGTAFGLTTLIITSSQALAADYHNVPEWKVAQNKGIAQERAKKYLAAIPYYRQSLELLPANAFSERVDVQCQIAIDYVRMHQADKALPAINTMLSDFKRIRQSGSVNADTEMSVRALVEELDNTPPKVMNLKSWRERLELSDRICLTTLPDQINPQRIANNTRGFLGLGSPAEALRYCEKYYKQMSPAVKNYLEFKTSVAALKNLLKQPQMLKDLTAQMLKKQSPVQVACAVAKAQTWATDYDGSVRTIDDCERDQTKQKRLSQADIINLNYARLANALDRGNWAYGETVARRTLAFKLDENVRSSFLDGLIECLRRQNKTKDVAALEAKKRSQFNFLAEEERAAAEESRIRREKISR